MGDLEHERRRRHLELESERLANENEEKIRP